MFSRALYLDAVHYAGLALRLFVFRICTDHHDFTFTSDDFTLFAHWFH